MTQKHYGKSQVNSSQYPLLEKEKMNKEFKKFPRTPHLPCSGKVGKEDKSISWAEFHDALGKGSLTVQEKFDGANLGVSLQDGKLQLQSRGHILNGGGHPQFHPAWNYFYQYQSILEKGLGESKILFGEWLHFVHHVYYDVLSNYFKGFDVYDYEKDIFLSQRAIRKTELRWIPWVSEIRFAKSIFEKSEEEIKEYLGGITLLSSASRSDSAEGLYFRIEDDEKVILRAKYVREDFFPEGEDEFVRRKEFKKNKIGGR